ncbi:MmgE/PrpD family protein [Pseudarthrobacter oxydans]|jgi:2-methylcitrate dehydratase PrpD|uniref:MmgE/PrpD family protein n=1 Tax=Pseudarthrobacter oxydans TaxID=1671 RepID=UPI002AA7948A|nr:MmgE/PrpD family protein [Pseudarthrobacter oxydans]WPU09519.1 MmgE/PrpD family protein [Pseudarthrobacter oxydans]
MDAPVTTALARHITEAKNRPLSPEIADRAKQHLLDSLVAMISGSTLRPGKLAIAYAESRGGTGESSIIGGTRTNPELAAFANAMCAHADETDDVNNRARIHPGASIVPAAVSIAEALDSRGSELLAAVSLGYDVAGAVNVGAWRTMEAMDQSPRTSHGLGQTFGAAAAAAFLSGLTMEQNRHVLSYSAQQVAGISTIYRDPEHIGKAFTTAAHQAHAGVRSVELVRFGFTGVHDTFDKSPNVFDAFGEEGSVDRMLQDLDQTRHVTKTDIKQYPIGGPIQPAAQALEHLINTESLRADNVRSIEVRLPPFLAYIIKDRPMPDINLKYIMSILLLEGRITFDNSHDYERFYSEPVKEIMSRVRVVGDPDLVPTDEYIAENGRAWRAIVTVETRDGRTLTERVDACRGAGSNPISWDRLSTKAHMALLGIMTEGQIDDLIKWVQDVDTASSTRDLTTFLATPTANG